MKNLIFTLIAIIAFLHVRGDAGVISGQLSVCNGSSGTLTSSMSGGTWSISDISFSIGVTSGTYVSSSPGTATVTYTLGAFTSTAVVTVHPLPDNIIGTSSICNGSGSSLSVPGSSGGTWSSSSPAILSVNPADGTVSGLSPGVAIITYTAASLCKRTISVTVYPLPDITSVSHVVCSGDTIVTSALGGVWSASPSWLFSVHPWGVGVSALSGPGSGTLSYTLPTGCFSTTTVNVLPPPGAITGNLGVCAGSTTTLTCTTTPGGTWSSASATVTVGAATGVIAGVSVGTALVTYTAGTGCRTTAVVTVHPLAGFMSGPYSVCEGLTTMLSEPFSGGIWSSGTPAVGSISTSGIVTGIAAGTTLVSYTHPTTGCSATSVLSVNPLPSPITGPDGFCNFSSASYVASPSGGTFSVSNPIVLSIDPVTGVTAGNSLGTATITYTLPTGCISSKEVFTIYAPYPITGPATVCAGDSFALVAYPAGGVWSSGSAAVASVSSSGMVTGIAEGSSDISYTLSTGCRSVHTVQCDDISPLSGPVVACIGSSVSLAVAASAGTWSGSNASATVSAVGEVTGIASGTVAVSYTTAAASCVAARTLNVTTACSGTPAPVTALTASAAVCTGSENTVSLPVLYPACGMSFQWQCDTGTGWTDIPGATETAYTSLMLVPAQYRAAITCGMSTVLSAAVPVAVGHFIASHSVIGSTDTACAPAHFHIAACSAASGLSVTTWYGDGSNTATAMATDGGAAAAHIYHTYTAPGTYTVKHVVYAGGIPQDSVSFSYEYHFCRTASVRYYMDNNTNCSFDAGDNYNPFAITTRVDSAGVPVDTIVATSGFYYPMSGSPGTVYGFQIINASGGISPSCPASGIVYDTVSAIAEHPARYAGLSCSGSSGHDISVSGTMACGRHTARYDMIISNLNCPSVSPQVTLTFSPEYDFHHATIPPTSVAGNTITWNLSSLSASGTATRYISVFLDRPGLPATWLLPGDTISSTLSAEPLSGDAVPGNNVLTRIDTVKSSYDPNDIQVTPEGYILPCTQLEYRIRFENLGNDTAHNIYVLDTLSASLDENSLTPVVATAPMVYTLIHDGAYTIAKFDFPDINLPDSADQDNNKGMVLFTVNARNGIADDTHISNRAGIYFDDNPVVMTNEVENITGLPALTGPDSVCVGTDITLATVFPGGLWSVANPAASVNGGVASGLTQGLDTVYYTVSNSCTSRTVQHEIYVNDIPSAASIAGDSVTCEGWIILFTGSATDGIWSVGTPAVASIDAGGLLTGISAGTTQVSYTRSNTCGAVTTTAAVTVNGFVTPSVSLTHDAAAPICAGTEILFTALTVNGGDEPLYMWLVNGEVIQGLTENHMTYTPIDGDIITAQLTSSLLCVTNNTDVADTLMHITPVVLPAVTASVLPSGILCQSSAAVFSAVSATGGTSPQYMWELNGTQVATGPFYSYLPSDGDIVGVKLASSLPCLLVDTVASPLLELNVDSAYIPVVTIGMVPGAVSGHHQSFTFTAYVSGTAGPAPHYQWLMGSTAISGATDSVYTATISSHDSVTCIVVGSGVCALQSFNSVKVSVVPVGMDEVYIGAGTVQVVPNPGNGNFTISGQLGSGDDIAAEVTDVLGRIVYKTHLQATGGAFSSAVSLPGTLSGGSYIIRLYTGTDMAVARIIVVR